MTFVGLLPIMYEQADALAKKCWVGLLRFLQDWMWRVAFDSTFTAAKKSKTLGRSAVQCIDERIGLEDPLLSYDYEDHVLRLLLGMSELDRF